MDFLKSPDDFFDHKKFQESVFSIIDKKRCHIPFSWNMPQIKLWNFIKTYWPDFKGIRLNILKARQHGISTALTAHFMQDTIQNPNSYSITMTHSPDSSEMIFLKVKNYLEDLEKLGIAPKVKYNSKRELYFDKNTTASLITTPDKAIIPHKLNIEIGVSSIPCPQIAPSIANGIIARIIIGCKNDLK